MDQQVALSDDKAEKKLDMKSRYDETGKSSKGR